MTAAELPANQAKTSVEITGWSRLPAGRDCQPGKIDRLDQGE
jgi:hypothetical protein